MQVFELDLEHRGLHAVEPAVIAHDVVLVFDDSPVVAKPPYRVRNGVVVRNHSARVATRSQVFSRIKTEACRISHASCSSAVVTGAVSWRRIFSYSELLICRNIEYGAHVRRLAVQMNRYDRLGVLGDAVFDLLDVDVVSPDIDIDEDRRCAAVDDGFGGGDETVGGNDDFVTFPDLQGLQSKEEGIRAVADADGMTDFAEFRERSLEIFNRGGAGESGAIEDFVPDPAKVFAQETMFGLEFHEGDFHC